MPGALHSRFCIYRISIPRRHVGLRQCALPESSEPAVRKTVIPKAPLTYESFIFTRDASLISTFDR